MTQRTASQQVQPEIGDPKSVDNRLHTPSTPNKRDCCDDGPDAVNEQLSNDSSFEFFGPDGVIGGACGFLG